MPVVSAGEILSGTWTVPRVLTDSQEQRPLFTAGSGAGAGLPAINIPERVLYNGARTPKSDSDGATASIANEQPTTNGREALKSKTKLKEVQA
jgi:hypothetical protein